MRMKSLKVWKKSRVICRRIQDTQDLTNNFHQTKKVEKHANKTLRVLIKMKIFKIFQKNWSSLIKIPWKIDFLTIFTKNIFKISSSIPKVYTHGRELHFSEQFFQVPVGKSRHFIPPHAIYKVLIQSKFLF